MPSIPPPLPRLDAARFRQQLAGLIIDEAEQPLLSEDFKSHAAALCVLLARHYDPAAKDRLALWEHIAKALALACCKVDSGDIDQFLSLCLDNVRAEHARVVSDEQSEALIGDLADREESWRLGFLRYIRSHSYVVLVHGRRAWEADKQSRQPARDKSRKAGSA